MQPPDSADVQRAIGDRYELLAPVGAGGMGFVYSARHRALGHIVAVKVLPPEVAASEMRLKRFQQEAALAASLAHPHIVPVYDFGSRAGITFLIMPFVRGVTYESVLATSRPPLARGLRVAREVGAALDHAHQRGVVHRDVKPANILIDEDSGRALLADFGVAHVVRAASSALTAPGVPIGTPGYMAPEQEVGSEELDGRADLYSLAVVTFEALTGTRPARGADRTTLARSLRGARPEVSAAVAAALVAPLAPERDQRPGTVAAWLAAVDRAGARPWRRWGTAAATIAVALGRTQHRRPVRRPGLHGGRAPLRARPTQRPRGRLACRVLRCHALHPTESGLHGTARAAHRPAVPTARAGRAGQRRLDRAGGLTRRPDDARWREGAAADARSRRRTRAREDLPRWLPGVRGLPQSRRSIPPGRLRAGGGALQRGHRPGPRFRPRVLRPPPRGRPDQPQRDDAAAGDHRRAPALDRAGAGRQPAPRRLRAAARTGRRATGARGLSECRPRGAGPAVRPLHTGGVLPLLRRAVRAASHQRPTGIRQRPRARSEVRPRDRQRHLARAPERGGRRGAAPHPAVRDDRHDVGGRGARPDRRHGDLPPGGRAARPGGAGVGAASLPGARVSGLSGRAVRHARRQYAEAIRDTPRHARAGTARRHRIRAGARAPVGGRGAPARRPQGQRPSSDRPGDAWRCRPGGRCLDRARPCDGTRFAGRLARCAPAAQRLGRFGRRRRGCGGALDPRAGRPGASRPRGGAAAPRRSRQRAAARELKPRPG